MVWTLDIETGDEVISEYNLSKHLDFNSILFLEDTLKIISDKRKLIKGKDYIVKITNDEVKIVFQKPNNRKVYKIFFETILK